MNLFMIHVLFMIHIYDTHTSKFSHIRSVIFLPSLLKERGSDDSSICRLRSNNCLTFVWLHSKNICHAVIEV